jgi:predicted GNAT family N-acyltransferase
LPGRVGKAAGRRVASFFSLCTRPTRRCIPKTKDGIKLERFAVLDQYRGQGIGQALVTTVLNDLPADATYVYLHAQLPAVGLYEKFGFEKTGPEFEEAGIRHYKMVLKK